MREIAQSVSPISNQSKLKNPEESFERFMEIFPRREDKKRAFEVWQKKGLNCIADEIIEKTIALVKAKDWTDKAKKQYCPHPTTFLNGERWNDEVDIPDTPSSLAAELAFEIQSRDNVIEGQSEWAT